MLQKSRTSPGEGLSPEAARSAVTELGRALGMPDDLVTQAFMEEADEFQRQQTWLLELDAQPSTAGIARRFERELRAHFEGAAKHDKVRVVRLQSEIRVLLQSRIRPGWQFLGLTLRKPRYRTRAVVALIRRPAGTLVEAALRDAEAATIIGPAIHALRDALGDRVEVGRIMVDDVI